MPRPASPSCASPNQSTAIRACSDIDPAKGGPRPVGSALRQRHRHGGAHAPASGAFFNWRPPSSPTRPDRCEPQRCGRSSEVAPGRYPQQTLRAPDSLASKDGHLQIAGATDLRDSTQALESPGLPMLLHGCLSRRSRRASGEVGVPRSLGRRRLPAAAGGGPRAGSRVGKRV